MNNEKFIKKENNLKTLSQEKEYDEKEISGKI